MGVQYSSTEEVGWLGRIRPSWACIACIGVWLEQGLHGTGVWSPCERQPLLTKGNATMICGNDRVSRTADGPCVINVAATR